MISLFSAEKYCQHIIQNSDKFIDPSDPKYKNTPDFQPIHFFNTYSFDELANLSLNAKKLKNNLEEKIYKLEIYLFDII